MCIIGFATRVVSLKPFVANRIAEIQRLTNPEQWRHVPGIDNPADLPTRGLSAANLSENCFWMEGPSFLKEDESTWPSKPSKEVDKPDDCKRRSTVKTYATKDCHQCASIDPTKFSSLRHLYRVTGWVKRFIANCKIRGTSGRNFERTLSPAEISDVETFWIKYIQAESS